VAPTQVGWHVPVGSGPVVAQVNVANTGSGSLEWTASEPAAWLELNAAAGTAPAQILLTADPSGIADGASVSTQLVVSGPDGQSITVPVTLIVGEAFNAEPMGGLGLFRRGDCNGDSAGDISDAIFALGFLFAGGPASDCPEACDANGDAETDLSDAVYILGALFTGGPPPVAPYPECGPDPEPASSLGCARSTCP